jgi:hypothetical protein
MAAGVGQVSVELRAGPDTDADELAQLAGRLRAELLDVDVDDGSSPRAGRPRRSRRAPAGELIVQLVTSAQALISIIAWNSSWRAQ